MHHQLLVTATLEHAGYAVVTAGDAQQALAYLAATVFDLAIVDVQLSEEMDGLELVTQLKADPVTANLPVMLLSARTQDSEVACGLATGADCYITKPFKNHELVTRVRRCLESHSK